MSEADDKHLILQAQQGDERAFETLLRRYYDRIFGIAYSWCLKRDLAQDITQAICLAIVKNLRSYNHNATFLTWVYRIVINTAKNMAKGDRVRLYRESEFVQDNADQHVHSAHEVLEHQQTLALIHTLPDSIKQALLLVHYQGLNHKQAAQVLNCAELTISWRIHKARKLLAERLL